MTYTQWLDKAISLAEEMMRASWATGRDADWHPARAALAAHLASLPLGERIDVVGMPFPLYRHPKDSA